MSQSFYVLVQTPASSALDYIHWQVLIGARGRTQPQRLNNPGSKVTVVSGRQQTIAGQPSWLTSASMKYHHIWDIARGSGLWQANNPAQVPLPPHFSMSKVDPTVWATCDTPNTRRFERNRYPVTSTTIISPSIHDIASIQQLLENERNYTTESRCEIFEIWDDANFQPVGRWTHLGPSEVSGYFEKELPMSHKRLRMRAILETIPGTSFGFRLALTKSDTIRMLSDLGTCPQFCPYLFGEPDYCAPLEIRSRQKSGKIDRAEFCYQHPRYDKNTGRNEPCSVYLLYDVSKALTTYIITSAGAEAWVNRAKSRLTDYYIRSNIDTTLGNAESVDPFLLQSILCHESLMDAKRLIGELRGRLYTVLDVVAEYSRKPADKRNLNDITHQLHRVSKDADSLYGSVEAGSMIAIHCDRARRRLLPGTSSAPGFAASNVGDALTYLVDSLDSQKRYIQSYKSRKDTAMNLVFNLVTQQDSMTSTQIARDTRLDSASMKTIATLTMIFLPATTVSGFFGMAFFQLSDNGNLVVGHGIWIFVITTVLITGMILVLWAFWQPLLREFKSFQQHIEG